MRREADVKVFDNVESALRLIEPLRALGRRLVTTNGCFDLLHAGHVRYLYEAAQLGDILAVGVNGDATVRRLKGESRPLQNQQDRCRIVAALEMVDCAFIFTEEDPRAFLQILRPDVHVKGGDYTADIIEAEVVRRYGGVVRTVSFLSDRSTTSIIAQAARSVPARS